MQGLSRSFVASKSSSRSTNGRIWLRNRFFGNLQYPMTGELSRQGLSILQGFAGRDFELRTNPLLDDFIQRGRAVRSLPDEGRGPVKREKRRVPARHNHHLAVE